MQYVATIFLALMTIIFVVCGILLWKRRKETNDYSRTTMRRSANALLGNAGRRKAKLR
jgi:cbb3-type cytochrome oxidase subunit 3